MTTNVATHRNRSIASNRRIGELVAPFMLQLCNVGVKRGEPMCGHGLLLLGQRHLTRTRANDGPNYRFVSTDAAMPPARFAPRRSCPGTQSGRRSMRLKGVGFCFVAFLYDS